MLSNSCAVIIVNTSSEGKGRMLEYRMRGSDGVADATVAGVPVADGAGDGVGDGAGVGVADGAGLKRCGWRR